MTVKATCGTQTSLPSNEDGHVTLALAEVPAVVDLEVTASKGTTTTAVTHGSSDVTVTWEAEDQVDAAKLNGTISVKTSDDLGRYVFKVDEESATLFLSKTKNEDALAPSSDTDLVAEVSRGEYDGTFAICTGFATFIVVALIVNGLVGAATKMTFPEIPIEVPDDKWVSGTYAEHVAHLIVLIAATAGAASLILGGWLAALETRGRLQQTITVTQRGAVSRGLADETGKAIASVVNTLKHTRGTIAVLSVSGVVLMGALVASTLVAVYGDGPKRPELLSSAKPAGDPGATSGGIASRPPTDASGDETAEKSSKAPVEQAR